MSKSVLIIGTYCIEGVDSFKWCDKLPNISDFDIIILDTTKILDFWLSAGRVQSQRRDFWLLSDVNEEDVRIKQNINLVRSKLKEILEFPRHVYALYEPNICIESKPDVEADSLKKEGWIQIGLERVRGGKTPLGVINTNDWCPISIQTVSEIGKKIEVKNKSYKRYFDDFKEWNYYFDSESLEISQVESIYEQNWKVTSRLEFIATNKSNKPIAVEISFRFHYWDKIGHGWRNLPHKTGGALVLLPIAGPDYIESHIERILEIEGLLQTTSPPSWVSTIEIPGEAKITNEITAHKEQIATTELKIQQLQLSLVELQRYKGLLYEKGTVLQELVRSTLQELGAVIEPSIVTDEFMINVGGNKALIEIKGVEKGILKRHLGQLHLDLGRHEDETGEQIKGILIGNAWRLLPLEHRDTSDKPIFHYNVRNDAEKISIGLLSTTELFKVYCRTRENPQLKEDILNRIIGGEGVITF